MKLRSIIQVTALMFLAICTQTAAAADTSLIYLHARLYDPALGRFILPDPANQGPNPFAYAGNSPATMQDRSGLFATHWPLTDGGSDDAAGTGQSGSTTNLTDGGSDDAAGTGQSGSTTNTRGGISGLSTSSLIDNSNVQLSASLSSSTVSSPVIDNSIVAAIYDDGPTNKRWIDWIQNPKIPGPYGESWDDFYNNEKAKEQIDELRRLYPKIDKAIKEYEKGIKTPVPPPASAPGPKLDPDKFKKGFGGGYGDKDQFRPSVLQGEYARGPQGFTDHTFYNPPYRPPAATGPYWWESAGAGLQQFGADLRWEIQSGHWLVEVNRGLEPWRQTFICPCAFRRGPIWAYPVP